MDKLAKCACLRVVGGGEHICICIYMCGFFVYFLRLWLLMDFDAQGFIKLEPEMWTVDLVMWTIRYKGSQNGSTADDLDPSTYFMMLCYFCTIMCYIIVYCIMWLSWGLKASFFKIQLLHEVQSTKQRPYSRNEGNMGQYVGYFGGSGFWRGLGLMRLLGGLQVTMARISTSWFLFCIHLCKSLHISPT